MKNLIVVTTIGMWGIVILEIAVLLFFKFSPQKRILIGEGFTEKQKKGFKVLRGVIMFWMIASVLVLIPMTIELCGKMAQNYEILTTADLERLKTVYFVGFTFFSILLPSYVSLHLIPKIFKKES